jgi:hypothetical protein
MTAVKEIDDIHDVIDYFVNNDVRRPYQLSHRFITAADSAHSRVLFKHFHGG